MGDTTFVTVMKTIDVVIVNPLFLVVFLGAPGAAAAVLVWQRSGSAVAGAVLAAATSAITIALNVPLNNALSRGSGRDAFESRWVLWNALRTLTGTASFVCLLAA